MEPLLTELAATPASTDPKDHKGVRTTFNVSEQALKELNRRATIAGTSQKQVIDQYARVLEVLPKSLWPKYYEAVCPVEEPTRRTMVVSDRAKRVLERKAKEFKVSRDEVFETMIRLFEDVQEESPKRIRKLHEQAFDLVHEFMEIGLEYEQNLKNLLDKGDPVITRFYTVMVVIENLEDALRVELNGGDPVNPDDY